MSTPASALPDDPTGRAGRMLALARLLRHPKAETPGGRLMLAPWQEDILSRIYAPADEDGRRLIRTVLIMLPRGNRKTSLAAVLAIGHGIGPEARPNGQIVLAASSRGQARIAFDEITGILRMDDRLLAAAKIQETKSKVRHARTRSVIEAIAADGDRAHGLTPSLAVVDELHAWRGERGRRLWDAIRTGLAKTPGSLLVVISTAGERAEGPLWDLYSYGKRILAGEVDDPSFLPIIYEAPADLAWDDEATWHVANPGLAYGYPDLDALRDAARQSAQMPALRHAFEIFHLNRWGDGSAAAWIDISIYDEGAAPVDREALRGRACWIGVDLSRSYDLTATVTAFPDEDEGYTVLPLAFLPEATARRRAAESDTPWLRWRDQGHLIVTPGAVQDEDRIESELRAMCEEFEVMEIAFDPAFAGRLMSRLRDDGFPVVEHPQRAAVMAPGVAELERAIMARKFRHGGHPVLRYCISCITPRVGETGLTVFSKTRSRDAIDLAQAAAMAVGRAAAASAPVLDIYDAEDFDPRSVIFEWS
jgi:phage terminase large subunit-like protein